MSQSSFQGFTSPRPDKKAVGSNIKSIQRGSYSFTSGLLTMTITVSPITTANSIVRVMLVPTGSPKRDAVTIEITNSTTLTLTRQDSGATTSGSWVLEEYNNVRSLQTGSINPASGIQAITISSVNINKCILCVSHSSATLTDGGQYFMYQYDLTNATTITLNFAGASNLQYTVLWRLIEFY